MSEKNIEGRRVVKGKLWISFQSKLHSSLADIITSSFGASKCTQMIALKVPIIRFNILLWLCILFPKSSYIYIILALTLPTTWPTYSPICTGCFKYIVTLFSFTQLCSNSICTAWDIFFANFFPVTLLLFFFFRREEIMMWGEIFVTTKVFFCVICLLSSLR